MSWSMERSRYPTTTSWKQSVKKRKMNDDNNNDTRLYGITGCGDNVFGNQYEKNIYIYSICVCVCVTGRREFGTAVTWLTISNGQLRTVAFRWFIPIAWPISDALVPQSLIRQRLLMKQAPTCRRRRRRRGRDRPSTLFLFSWNGREYDESTRKRSITSQPAIHLEKQ